MQHSKDMVTSCHQTRSAAKDGVTVFSDFVPEHTNPKFDTSTIKFRRILSKSGYSELIMYFESTIIDHIVGFLNEQCAALPILRTDLETIILFSSAFEDMNNSVRNSCHQTNLKIKKVKTILAGTHKESTRLVSLNAKIQLEKSELKAWDAQQAHFADVQTFESTIKLNVGGRQYFTSLSTLRQYPDTMLGAMFSGRHTILPDADGSYFIDRDGTHFRHILNLLRSPKTCKVVSELPLSVQEELKCECDYYGLFDLMFPCNVPFPCRNGTDKEIEITQDEEGRFCVNERLISVCSNCGSAEYSNCGIPYSYKPYESYIPHFKRIVVEKGGKVLPAQPILKGFCYNCNRRNN